MREESSSERLYAEVSQRAFRLAYALTGDRHLAEDATNEAFLRVYKRLGRLRDPDRLSSYVLKVVLNVVREFERTRSARQSREDRVNSAGGSHAPRLPDPDTSQFWIVMLRKLPLRQRVALFLRFYEDLSEAQTAARMGCSASAVKSLTNRGLRKLRELTEREMVS